MSGQEQGSAGAYQEEAQRRLARLSALAQSLRSAETAGPPSPGVLGEMSLEAVALTDGAALTGLPDVARVAQALADLLGQLHAAQATVSGDLVDGLLAGIDGLRTLTGAALGGEAHGRQADGLEAALRSVRVAPDTGGLEPTADEGSVVERAADQPGPGLTLTFRPARPAAQQELVRLVREAAAAWHRLGASLYDRLGPDLARLTEYRALSALLGRLQEQIEQEALVPGAVTVRRCLPVRAGAQRCALPLTAVSGVLSSQEADSAAGQPIVWFGDRSVPLADLATTLEVAGSTVAHGGGSGAVVVLAELDPPHAFAVDAVTDPRDLVVQELSPLLPALEAIGGAALEPDGQILLVLEPAGLVARARRAGPS